MKAWIVVCIAAHGTEFVTDFIVRAATKREAQRIARQRFGNRAIKLVRI